MEHTPDPSAKATERTPSPDKEEPVKLGDQADCSNHEVYIPTGLSPYQARQCQKCALACLNGYMFGIGQVRAKFSPEEFKHVFISAAERLLNDGEREVGLAEATEDGQAPVLEDRDLVSYHAERAITSYREKVRGQIDQVGGCEMRRNLLSVLAVYTDPKRKTEAAQMEYECLISAFEPEPTD